VNESLSVERARCYVAAAGKVSGAVKLTAPERPIEVETDRPASRPPVKNPERREKQ
jgi:hypothetical protein